MNNLYIAQPLKNNQIYFRGEKTAKENFKALEQSIKTQLVLCDLSPVASVKNVIRIQDDPGAVIYGLLGRTNDTLLSHNKIAKTEIPMRRGGKKLPANIMRYNFADGSMRHSIKRFGETLAYVDTTLIGDNLHVDYLCSINGRKKFRGLEKLVLQAAIEDTINQNGVIPEITALPAEIGSIKFDRATLYRYMGAESMEVPKKTPNGGTLYIEHVYCSKEKIIEKLDKIAKKDAFIFPETKENFERLKKEIL